MPDESTENIEGMNLEQLYKVKSIARRLRQEKINACNVITRSLEAIQSKITELEREEMEQWSKDKTNLKRDEVRG